MKSLFDHNQYRVYLMDLCSSHEAKRGFQSQLARAAGCQAAYFSQVLKQRVHLTEDQIFSVSQELELSAAETKFLNLIFRYEKAGTEKLRRYLENEIFRAKEDQNKISSRVPADKIIHSAEDLGWYFSSWIPSAVHVITSSEKNQTVDKIGQRLHLPKEEIKKALGLLVKMGWVKKIEQEYHYASGNIHIAKDSPLHSSMQTARRQLALNSIALNPIEAIHFSSVFTLDQESFENLRKLTTAYIQKSAKTINDGGTDELYTLCLDLFKVP